MSTPPVIPPLPERSGSYLWLYADAVVGDVTAVCIFLVGSVFSPRYAAPSARRASPLEHCAVNFALYRRGRRVAWVFSEYPGLVHAGPRALAIGNSTLTYARDGRLVLVVAERTAPWGQPLHARLEITPACAATPEIPLDTHGFHIWEPRMVRATSWLDVPALGIAGSGRGYHDANRGAAALGDGVPGWWWSRVHAPETSLVRYGVHGNSYVIEVAAEDAHAPAVHYRPAPERRCRRSGWGLALPTDIGAGSLRVRARDLLESSPFYARRETRAADLHALGEAADFRRFRSPLVRWMAYFRMRTERAA